MRLITYTWFGRTNFTIRAIFRRVRKTARSDNQLRHVRASFRPSASPHQKTRPTGQIVIKFDIWVFFDNLPRNKSFIKMAQQSVRLSAWNNLAPTRQILMTFDIWLIFENMPRNFKFHKILTRITDSLPEDLCTFIISPWIILRMRNVSHKNRNKIQTHILFPSTYYFFSKIMLFIRHYGKHCTVKQAKNDNMAYALRMRILKARNTHS
jgi:hypothetical protein